MLVAERHACHTSSAFRPSSTAPPSLGHLSGHSPMFDTLLPKTQLNSQTPCTSSRSSLGAIQYKKIMERAKRAEFCPSLYAWATPLNFSPADPHTTGIRETKY